MDPERTTIPNPQTILALNSGSSSLKLSVYQSENGNLERLALGEAEEIGSENGKVKLKVRDSVVLQQSGSFPDADAAAEYLGESLAQNGLPRPDVIGHRIVHGGPSLREHQIITPDVLRRLNEAIPFAPLHLPAALQVVRHTMQLFEGVPQIACFDTAFHRTLPEYAARLPFPKDFWENGIRRYGFHGLSFESIVHTLGPELPQRVIVAHLGNGCSLCAIRDGKSIDTTMGLTPTGGVMMGTRSGDLDPGVLLHLLRAERYSGETLDQLLNHSSGLKGVSGETNDMRQLLARANTDKAAALAVEMFCYSIAKFVAAMSVALGGVDMLVFTGGIGEHAAPIRARICSRLEHLGMVLDEAANRKNANVISAAKTSPAARVIPTDEDLQIARHCIEINARQYRLR